MVSKDGSLPWPLASINPNSRRRRSAGHQLPSLGARHWPTHRRRATLAGPNSRAIHPRADPTSSLSPSSSRRIGPSHGISIVWPGSDRAARTRQVSHGFITRRHRAASSRVVAAFLVLVPDRSVYIGPSTYIERRRDRSTYVRRPAPVTFSSS